MMLYSISKRLLNSTKPGESCITKSGKPFQLVGGREKLGQVAASWTQA